VAHAPHLRLTVAERAELQRRTLRVLVGGQILAALAGSSASAGALLAFDITGSDALASLPLALVVVGSSLTVVPTSAISAAPGGASVSLARRDRRSRRNGNRRRGRARKLPAPVRGERRLRRRR
jgi:hypothetical protein